MSVLLLVPDLVGDCCVYIPGQACRFTRQHVMMIILQMMMMMIMMIMVWLQPNRSRQALHPPTGQQAMMPMMMFTTAGGVYSRQHVLKCMAM